MLLKNFSEDVGKTAVKKVLQNYQKNVFSSVPLNASKNKLLTKFLKLGLKLTEIFLEVISDGVPYQKFTNLQNAALSLACF